MVRARSMLRKTASLVAACVLALVAATIAGQAQARPATPPQASAQTPAQPEVPKDSLGRGTPRGTVLGFLNAAHKGENELAAEYLDTKLTGPEAEDLAHQLFVVLDARLPARLKQLSDEPEGSRSNPLTPDEDLVGTITSAQGSLNIVVDRVQRGKAAPVWLFSNKTLEAVPVVYEEITQGQGIIGRLRALVGTRTGGIRLLEWLFVLFVVAVFYFGTVLLNRVLTALIGRVRARIFKSGGGLQHGVLPAPARLLLLALVGRWVLSNLSLSLFVRQFWSNAASLVTIAAVVWLLILLNGEIEQYIRRRLPRFNVSAATSLLRLFRRGADVLVIFGGLLATLRLFAVDATPALAGLGVGGIAVALAAQKTLENVVAGASLIFDQAVRVGDFLKVGELSGTVDHIGLRSTRIRTLDRTVVSIPNSQIANTSLETLSARDKFWFHPTVGLRYETTPEQLHAVVDGIRTMLDAHPLVDRQTVRVRFIRLGASSLDVDVFAYLLADDWNHFLQIQEQFLFGITEIVNRAGTGIAFPSQTMYLVGEKGTVPAESLR